MTVAEWVLFLSGVGVGVVLSILLTAPAYRKQAASIRELIAESDANIAETARIKQRVEEWLTRQESPQAHPTPTQEAARG